MGKPHFASEQHGVEPIYDGPESPQYGFDYGTADRTGYVYKDGPAPVPDADVVTREELGRGAPLPRSHHSPNEGKALRDRAIARVDKDPAWKKEVLGWIRNLGDGAQ